MLKRLTPLTFLIVFAAVAQAQPAVTDSLVRLIPKTRQDSNLVILYNRIGNASENTDVVGARQYFNKAIELGRKIRDTNWWAKSLIGYSGTFMITGNYDSCLWYQQQAHLLAARLKDSILIGETLFNMGVAYRDMADYENAIKFSLEGKAIMESRSSKHSLVEMNDALGVLYEAHANPDKAIEYASLAVRLAREAKDPTLLGQCLINYAMPLLQTKQWEKCLASLEEARQIGIDQKDTRIESYALINLADYYLSKEDFAMVKQISMQSLAMQKKIGTEEGEAPMLRGIAISYLVEKDYRSARQYAEQALEIAQRLHIPTEEVAALKLLSGIDFAMGNPMAGYRRSSESDSITDKITQDVLSEKSLNLEKKYETEKKEIRIKELEAEQKVQQLSIRQKNWLNYILIGSAFFLVVLIILLRHNGRQKQKLQQQRINELETEKRLTATEAVLKGEEQERTRLARELHDGLGGMLSGIKHSFRNMQGNLMMTDDNMEAFERGMDMLDSSIREMRRVAHNMMPEALVKFGLDAAVRDFCNDVTKSGALQVTYVSYGLENVSIGQTTAITIYRIVQELLNNTIKHAGARTAIVQIMRSDGQLSVTVEDNGRGFDTGILARPAGIGWSNIRSRVEFLKGQLSVQSDTGKGTSVHIELPS